MAKRQRRDKKKKGREVESRVKKEEKEISPFKLSGSLNIIVFKL